MNLNRHISTVAAAALTFALVAGPAMAQDEAPAAPTAESAAPAVESAAAPTEAAEKPAKPAKAAKGKKVAAPVEIAPAPADQGQVVFFRASKLQGAAISFKVREGETEIGKLSNGSYFVANLPTGAHEFVVHSESADKLTLEIDAGETYFVQATMSMGVVLWRPNLAPADQPGFEKVSAKLKQTSLN